MCERCKKEAVREYVNKLLELVKRYEDEVTSDVLLNIIIKELRDNL